MKTLYCSACHIKIAEIANGSKLRKGMVVLCAKCEIKRIASDIHNRTKRTGNAFDDLFNTFGRR